MHPRLLAGAAAAALTALALPVAPGAAQSAPRLLLRSQTVAVPQGTPIDLVLQLDGAVPEDATLVVSVGRRYELPATEIERVLSEGEMTSPALTLQETPLADVARDDAGRLRVRQTTAPEEGPRPPEATRLADPGIYPVLVEVRDDDGQALASLLTAVYRPPDGDAGEVDSPVALVMAVSAPPALQADGAVVPDATALDELATMAAALGAAPDVPATLSLPPELLQQLAGTGDVALLDRLSAALPRREVLAGPLVSFDPSTAVASGLAGEFTAQLRWGEEALLAALPQVRPSRGVAVLPGASAPGLSLLRDLGVRSVVLPPSAVAPAEAVGFVGTGHVLRTVDDDPPVALTVWDQLFATAAARAGSDRVLAAHRSVLALLATHLDALAFGDTTRGTVLVPPAGWGDDPVFLGTVLSLLGTTPPLRPVTLSDWFVQVEPPFAGGTVRLAATAVPDQSALADRLGASRLAVASYTSMAVERPDLAGSLEDLLRRTVATQLDDEGREPYFAAVDNQNQGLRAAVLPVEEDSFTITSRTARLPITVRTAGLEPLEVKVRLRSAKLVFPEGDVTVVVEGGRAQVDVPVEARANGTFQVEVALLTPVGDAPLAAPTRLTVRSAGLSGLGIAVTAAAVLVLVLWWVHHVRTQRAATRTAHAAARDRHPSGEAPAAEH